MRTILKPVVALAALAAVVLSATDASAFGHRRWGSSGGSWGSSGGSWGSSGGSWGSSGGSSGGSWGSSGGSSGGSWGGHDRWGSSGGSWGSSGGSWGSSGGGWGSSGGSWGGGSSGGYTDGGVIYGEGQEGYEVHPSTPMPQDAVPAEAAEGKSAFTGAGMLLVKVPADAKIFVNGKATTTSGAERQYISRGLVRGASYNFEVKAELVRDGQPVTITKSARLTAGGNAELIFDSADEAETIASEPMTTKLTVRVPTNAKVYLAGNETRQTGDVREFSTTKFGAGDGWIDYTVRAEYEQEGQLLTKEQVVSINAGESKEISFDFADEAIAKTAQK